MLVVHLSELLQAQVRQRVVIAPVLASNRLSLIACLVACAKMDQNQSKRGRKTVKIVRNSTESRTDETLLLCVRERDRSDEVLEPLAPFAQLRLVVEGAPLTPKPLQLHQ